MEQGARRLGDQCRRSRCVAPFTACPRRQRRLLRACGARLGRRRQQLRPVAEASAAARASRAPRCHSKLTDTAPRPRPAPPEGGRDRRRHRVAARIAHRARAQRAARPAAGGRAARRGGARAGVGGAGGDGERPWYVLSPAVRRSGRARRGAPRAAIRKRVGRSPTSAPERLVLAAPTELGSALPAVARPGRGAARRGGGRAPVAPRAIRRRDERSCAAMIDAMENPRVLLVEPGGGGGPELSVVGSPAGLPVVSIGLGVRRRDGDDVPPGGGAVHALGDAPRLYGCRARSSPRRGSARASRRAGGRALDRDAGGGELGEADCSVLDGGPAGPPPSAGRSSEACKLFDAAVRRRGRSRRVTRSMARPARRRRDRRGSGDPRAPRLSARCASAALAEGAEAARGIAEPGPAEGAGRSGAGTRRGSCWRIVGVAACRRRHRRLARAAPRRRRSGRC